MLKRGKGKVLALTVLVLLLFCSCGSEKKKAESGDGAAQYIESEYTEYYFRSEKLLTEHYEKHGIDMGFDSAKEYERAASDLINNEAALSKTEAEDGDMVFYLEESNEFAVLSKDGYIRTYFLPDAGKAYFDRQ